MLQFVVSISLNNQQLCKYFKMQHRVYWYTFSHYHGRLLSTRYEELPWANITLSRLLDHETGPYSQKFPPLYPLPTSATMPHVTCPSSWEKTHKWACVPKYWMLPYTWSWTNQSRSYLHTVFPQHPLTL